MNRLNDIFNDYSKYVYLFGCVLFVAAVLMFFNSYAVFNHSVSDDMVTIIGLMEKQDVSIKELPSDLKYLKYRTDFNTLATFWLILQLIFIFMLSVCVLFASYYFKLFMFKHRKQKTLKERVEALEHWRKYGGKRTDL